MKAGIIALSAMMLMVVASAQDTPTANRSSPDDLWRFDSEAATKAKATFDQATLAAETKYQVALENARKALIAELERAAKAEKTAGHKAEADKITEAIKAADDAEAIPREHQKVPNDAVLWQGHHYKMFVGEFAWTEAQRRCKKIGGHLATSSSEAANRFLCSLFVPAQNTRRPGSDSAWIGAFRNNKGKWQWVSGETSKYNHWEPGKPWPPGRGVGLGWAGDADYMQFGKDGMWNSVWDTNASTGYICEWDN